MPHIVSTLTNSQLITHWEGKPQKGNENKPIGVAGKKMSVLIKGTIGAGVSQGISTPKGTVTRVTDEELEFLQLNDTFLEFFNRGHFTILKNDSEPAPKTIEEAIKDMPEDDGEAGSENGESLAGSAQLSIENNDFKEGGRAGGLAPSDETIV